MRTVLGAVCIYVLLGMMFAFVYAAINGLGDDAFFVQTTHATTPDFLYFSFITQTTVGYGDFTAAGDLGRALAVRRGAHRPALPGDDHRGAGEPAQRAQRRDPHHRPTRRPRPTRPRRDRQDGVRVGGRLGLGRDCEQVALVEEYSRPSDGRITTAATTNTTRIVHSVASGAAAARPSGSSGRMYGHCATPQPDHDGRDRADREQTRAAVRSAAAAARASRRRRAPR